MAKNTSQNVLSVLNFPVEHAKIVADSINGTILPDAFVQDVLVNASNAYQVAKNALNLSQNAL